MYEKIRIEQTVLPPLGCFIISSISPYYVLSFMHIWVIIKECTVGKILDFYAYNLFEYFVRAKKPLKMMLFHLPSKTFHSKNGFISPMWNEWITWFHHNFIRPLFVPIEKSLSFLRWTHFRFARLPVDHPSLGRSGTYHFLIFMYNYDHEN